MFDYMADEDALCIRTTTRAAAAERNILLTISDLSDPDGILASTPDNLIQRLILDLHTLIHQDDPK